MPPPAYGPASGGGLTGGANRASMGARFGGLVIDAILVAIVSTIVGLIFGLHPYSSSSSCSGGVCHTQTHFGFSFDLIALLVGAAYSAYFVGMRTQSIGHKVVGIRVVDAQSGTAIGPGRGAIRWVVMSITGAIFTLGYWSPFFDKERRRGWHDKASNAMAIKAN
jgi:uncharacterized RDD family membrane protein YckC